MAFKFLQQQVRTNESTAVVYPLKRAHTSYLVKLLDGLYKVQDEIHPKFVLKRNAKQLNKGFSEIYPHYLRKYAQAK